MTPLELLTLVIIPTLGQLPPGMDSLKARVMLIAIALQESALKYRRQLGNGPARGFWQFELGTEASKGGVWGVYLHKASRDHLRTLCMLHDVPFIPRAIWEALEHNDMFACGVARLMLWTAPTSLPGVHAVHDAWRYYLNVWRPGKPHESTWPAYYATAVETVNKG